MATLVDLTGYQYGVETAETSFEVKNFTVTVSPSFKQKFTDRVNNPIGFAIGALQASITMDGELSAASLGPLAFTFSTACTLGNDKDYNGLTTGDVFLDEITYTQTFNDVKKVSCAMSRDAGITA